MSSGDTQTGRLGAALREGCAELERAEGAAQLVLDRAQGAAGIIATAAEGSSSDLLADALGGIAEAEVLIGQVVAMYVLARTKIEEHINSRKLG